MKEKYYKHRRLGGRAGKMRLEHHIIWEQVNGPIPQGFEIHHIDGNPKNNDIENLKCLSRGDHQKTHSPHFGLLNGVWVRICKICREIGKPKLRPVCDECRSRMARIERRKNEET